jgi:hypothetical protein
MYRAPCTVGTCSWLVATSAGSRAAATSARSDVAATMNLQHSQEAATMNLQHSQEAACATSNLLPGVEVVVGHSADGSYAALVPVYAWRVGGVIPAYAQTVAVWRDEGAAATHGEAGHPECVCM